MLWLQIPFFVLYEQYWWVKCGAKNTKYESILLYFYLRLGWEVLFHFLSIWLVDIQFDKIQNNLFTFKWKILSQQVISSFEEFSHTNIYINYLLCVWQQQCDFLIISLRNQFSKKLIHLPPIILKDFTEVNYLESQVFRHQPLIILLLCWRYVKTEPHILHFTCKNLLKIFIIQI